MRTQMKNVQVENKEEGLSYVAVRSTPKQADTLLIVQQLLLGMAGASALMAIGAWLAISLVR